MLYRILLAVALLVLVQAESAHADNSNLEEKSRKTVACAAVSSNDYVASLLGHRPSDIFRARRERLERYRISSRTAALSRRVTPRDERQAAVRPNPSSRSTKSSSPRKESAPASGTLEMHASWYGPGFHGRPRADGKMFNQRDPTVVAHKTLPLGTRLAVTNPENGKRIEVVVRDRGPYIKGRDLDFSLAGAQQLGFEYKGVARLQVQILSYPNSQGAS